MTTAIPQGQTKKEPATATVKGGRAARKARVVQRRAHVAQTKAKASQKPTRTKKAAPARGGSKTAKIVDLLKRPAGASLKELTKATGWQPHSIRGFLSTLGKKTGTSVESFKNGDGERAYRISSK